VSEMTRQMMADWGPIVTRTVIKQREDDGTMTCPSCHGHRSSIANGGMDSMSIGRDEHGNTVITSTRYPCHTCNGAGRVQKCPHCGGNGVCR